MDKASFFLFNVFLNSFLAFFTAAMLIKTILFLFRIRPGRVASFLMMIPILKLPIDLFLYDFSRWSYAQGINPLVCQEGTRSLKVSLGGMLSGVDWFFQPIVSSIQFTVPGNMTFTLADLLGHATNPSFKYIFLGLISLLSIGFLARRWFAYYRSILELNSLANSLPSLDREIENAALSSHIKKRRVRVLTSSSLVSSLFVTGLISPIIFIPSQLSQILSQKEYEAVLAHELEHVRYKDGLSRLGLDLIGAVFWWVPTKWLYKQTEEHQEVGCDLNCKKYGIDPIDLASAVCKSAKYAIGAPQHLFAHHLTKQTVTKRVKTLLQPAATRFIKIRFAFACLAIGISIPMVLLGRFWTF